MSDKSEATHDVLQNKDKLYRLWAEDLYGYVYAAGDVFTQKAWGFGQDPRLNTWALIIEAAGKAATDLQHHRMRVHIAAQQSNEQRAQMLVFLKGIGVDVGGDDRMLDPEKLAAALKDLQERREREEADRGKGP